MNVLPKNTRGFTLVELLVVIAIIGVLMGLLLPAVQRAREAGRKVTCTSNLYQMAFAANRHDEAYGYLPGLLNKSPNPNHYNPAGSGTYSFCSSWPVSILSYMERKDVAEAWGTGVNPYISQFACPSTPPPNTSNPWLAYSGNAGAGVNADNDGVMLDTVPRNGGTKSLSLSDLADRDGTSTTLLFSEKSGPNTEAAYVAWNFSPGSIAKNANLQTVAFSAIAPLPPPVPVFGIDPSATITAASRIINSRDPALRLSCPSSNHVGGVITAFADGHTAFIGDQLKPWVYAQLLTSKTRWNSASNNYVWPATNAAYISPVVNTWLKTSPALDRPYVLSDADYAN